MSSHDKALTIVTAAAADPVSLAELKEHMRIDASNSDDDNLLTALITVATKYAQSFTRRQLVTATYDMFLDRFFAQIIIPLPPTQGITTVKYTDDQGAQQTLADTVYQLDKESEPARLRQAFNENWPTTRMEMNAVEIRFICGYGAASAVPEYFKTAIKMLAAHNFENGEATIVGLSIKKVPLGVDALLWQDRIF